MVLTKLLLAHMIGDFVLQPTSWIKAKEKKKLNAYQLYLHALVHALLIMVLIWDIRFIKWAIILAVSHLAIDSAKLLLQRDDTRRLYFFLDQLAHLISICLIYCLYEGYTSLNTIVLTDSNFLLITLLVFLTTPSSFIVKMFVAKWSSDTGDSGKESLDNAGKYIGILERLFVFAFVVGANWEAVGFLLAAKSVFRFGDLRKSKDRKLTEYILIGTLLSFGIAMLMALLYNALTLSTVN